MLEEDELSAFQDERRGREFDVAAEGAVDLVSVVILPGRGGTPREMSSSVKP
jgi:hypothetical protein